MPVKPSQSVLTKRWLIALTMAALSAEVAAGAGTSTNQAPAKAEQSPSVAGGTELSQASHSTGETLHAKPEVITNLVWPAPKPATIKREDLPLAFTRIAPGSVDELKTFEKHIEKLVSRISGAVVAVQVGRATGSGVVISEDGLVLSAAHVCRQPNREVIFTFASGKTARGRTLGTNHDVDAGLMKISAQGKWPHVEIGDLQGARTGDWVLGLGHPGGFEPDRAVVVRLGRLIRIGGASLQTDCTLLGGDSGGPLFDMYGRVIGIHSKIGDSTSANFHVSIQAYLDNWERLAKAENWGEDREARRSRR